MKKVLYIMLFLILGMNLTAQSVWDGSREAISSGSGTENDPYLIENAQQLAWLVYTINWDYSRWTAGKYFLLTTDIDLNGNADNQWIPIGAGPSTESHKYFDGVFDGGFHEITGLYIDGNNAVNDNNSMWVSDYVGFFAELGANAQVKNLYLEGLIISIRKSGGFSGKNGIFEYCISDVDIKTSGTQSASAGIAAYGNPTVRFSANLGDIKGTYGVGGIIGMNGTVENCYNVGNIEGVDVVGGIAGRSLKVKNCYNVGNVVYNEAANYKGAIVGNKPSGGNIDNCYYLEGCIADPNEYGEPKTAEFMRSQDFVNLLNNGITIWTMDTENINDGYPIFDEKYMNVSEITENTDKVVVYPNPVVDYVYVVGNVVSCDVYDLVGKCVKTVWKNVDKISVTDLSSGIYMMRFLTNDGNVVTKKIVKK